MLEAVGSVCVIIAVCLVIGNKRNEFIPWFLAFGFVAFGTAAALAHDHNRPDLDKWYSSVKQPDTGISCCGLSDAYWCNEGSKGSQVYCVIDDDRDNASLGRKPVPNGTVINIPAHKFNKDPNPTGHAVVWLSTAGHVWCFVGVSGS